MGIGASTAWQIIPFRDLFKRVERKVIISDIEQYDCVGVRWYGNGVYIRERRLGANISRKQQWIVRAGDVIYNKLFAWKGSFAVAESAVDGCIASDKFPTYAVNQHLLLPRFLQLFFTTPMIARQALTLSRGGAAISKLTLNPPQFWDLTIPLPPLDEQRRIVARLDALAARISEAQLLRQQAVEEADRITIRALESVYEKDSNQYPTMPIGELLFEASYGTSVKCEPKRMMSGVPVLRIPNITSEHISFAQLKYAALPVAESQQRMFLKEGDILVVRTNGSADLVGRSAVVPPLTEPTSFASYLIRLRFNTDQLLPNYAQATLKYHRLSGQMFDLARTSAGQYNVSLGRLRALPMPIPPIDEQRRIVAHLDALQAKVDALKALQAESAAELDALLPSLLDRAFKGEL